MIRIKIWLPVSFLTLFVSGIVCAPAQTPDVSPSGPIALPGDVMPPPPDIALHVPLGPAAGTPPAKKVEVPKVPLTFELAVQAANTAIASCAADGYRVGVAVSDEKGQPIVMMNADGAVARSMFIAARKNLAAVTFKVPTLALRDKVTADPSLLKQITPSMAVLPGGLPIMLGDRVVGAIATSGAAAHQEVKCATAGIDKIKSQLK